MGATSDIYEKAKELVHAWEFSSASDGGNFEVFAAKVLAGAQEALWMEAVERRLTEQLQKPENQARLDALATEAVKGWIRNEDIRVSEPSSRVAGAIDRAYRELDGRPKVFTQALKQLAVRALALSEEGVPIQQIARELELPRSKVAKLITDAKAERKTLVDMMRIYGYDIVKSTAQS